MSNGDFIFSDCCADWPELFAMVKNAARIDFPHKMHKEIFDWAQNIVMQDAKKFSAHQHDVCFYNLKETPFEVPQAFFEEYTKNYVSSMSRMLNDLRGKGDPKRVSKVHDVLRDLFTFNAHAIPLQKDDYSYSYSTSVGDIRFYKENTNLENGVYRGDILLPIGYIKITDEVRDIRVEDYDRPISFSSNPTSGITKIETIDPNWISAAYTKIKDFVGKLDMDECVKLHRADEPLPQLDLGEPHFVEVSINAAYIIEDTKYEDETAIDNFLEPFIAYERLVNNAIALSINLKALDKKIGVFDDIRIQKVPELPQKLLAESFIRPERNKFGQAIGIFPIDISDTEQWQKHQDFKEKFEKALKKDTETELQFKSIPKYITVEIFDYEDNNNGTWDDQKWKMSIWNTSVNLGDGYSVSGCLDDLSTTIKHELIHMMQSIMTKFLVDKEPDKFKKEKHCLKCGFVDKDGILKHCPMKYCKTCGTSVKTYGARFCAAAKCTKCERRYPYGTKMCKICNEKITGICSGSLEICGGELTERESGGPGNYSARHWMRYYGVDTDNKTEYHKQHATSDVEFFTRMQNSIDAIERNYGSEYIAGHEEAALRAKFNLFNGASYLSDLSSNQQSFLLNMRAKEFMQRDYTLKQLIAGGHLDMANKYSRELYREYLNLMSSKLQGSKPVPADTQKISCRIDDNIKQAREAEEDPDFYALYGQTKHDVNPNSLIRLYEIEYKRAQLKALNSSSPSTVRMIEKIEKEMALLLPALLAAMKTVYKWWVQYHGDVTDPLAVVDGVKQKYPELDPEQIEQEYYDFQVGTRTRHYDAFKDIENKLKQEEWSKPPLSTIMKTYQLLQRGATGDIDRDSSLFNTALTTAHFGGQMLVHFGSITGVSQELLSSLTTGKLNDQWDKEIARYSSLKLSKRASFESKYFKIKYEPTYDLLAFANELLKYPLDQDHMDVYTIQVEKYHITKSTASKTVVTRYYIRTRMFYTKYSSDRIEPIDVGGKELFEEQTTTNEKEADAMFVKQLRDADQFIDKHFQEKWVPTKQEKIDMGLEEFVPPEKKAFISRRAGMLDAPHKMVEEVFDLAWKDIQDMVSEGYRDFEDSIPIDISDAKQTIENKWITTGFAETCKHFPDFATLKIIFSYDKEEDGYWAMYDGNLNFYGFPRYLQNHPEPQHVDFLKYKLKEAVEHELRHMMQHIMNTAKSFLSLDNKVYHMGIPENYNPNKYQTYKKEQSEEEWSKQHAISDIEFFPRLSSSIFDMKDYVFKGVYRPQTPEERRHLEQLPIQQVDTANVQDLKERFAQWLSLDHTLEYLKQADIYRYNKYIRELHRVFNDELRSVVSKKASSNQISKRAENENGAGVFIALPSDLAKQFKSLGEHDDSKPHITVLYIGKNVPKNKEKTMAEAIEKVLSEQEPFEIKFDDKATYFDPTEHSDNCKIAKLSMISKGLCALHDKLKKALKEADVEIDDHFPDYKPHVTLEYMEPPKDKYEDDIPKGSFIADLAEIWGAAHKKKMTFGKKSKKAFEKEDDMKQISKRAKERPEPRFKSADIVCPANAPKLKFEIISAHWNPQVGEWDYKTIKKEPLDLDGPYATTTRAWPESVIMPAELDPKEQELIELTNLRFKRLTNFGKDRPSGDMAIKLWHEAIDWVTNHLNKTAKISKRAEEELQRAYRNPPQQSVRMLEQMAKDPLSTYKAKRDPEKTPEPEGKEEKGSNQHRFIIQ